MSNYDVAVIGGGPAGVTAALRARELGARRVVLLERGLPGGTCTNDGCAPTRVLAKAARLLRDSEQFAAYGLDAPPPTVDFQRVLARTQQVVYQLQEKKQLLDHLAEVEIEALTNIGPVQFADPHTVNYLGGALAADKFIIAAGGRSRKLDLPGFEHTISHSDVWRMSRLPASVVIVGAGATGCQLASVFEAFGAKVTVLDLAPRILPTEDEAVSRHMTDELAARGVEIITGIARVERIERLAGGNLRLAFIHHDESMAREADEALFSVGWPGNGDTLNLSAAGVELKGGFVVVNDQLQTTTPHIYAAGDITGRMMLVQSATQQARIAAENAFLGAGRAAEYNLVPHGGFTDPEYGAVGMTEAQARNAHGPEAVISVLVPYADMDRAIIDDRPVGFCKLIVARDGHKLLGAHVVGEQAVEIVQIAAATMASAGTAEHLAELEFAYPTFSAILGVAARQITRELNATPIGREWRTLTRLRIAEWERADDAPGKNAIQAELRASLNADTEGV